MEKMGHFEKAKCILKLLLVSHLKVFTNFELSVKPGFSCLRNYQSYYDHTVSAYIFEAQLQITGNGCEASKCRFVTEPHPMYAEMVQSYCD